jgi:hypothetical protein
LSEEAPSARRTRLPWPLLIPPATALLGVAIGPSLAVPDASADASAAALAVVPAVLALTLAARRAEGPAARGLLAGIAIAAVLVAWSQGLPRWLVPLQVFGLVAVAHGVGGFIGRKVEHAGHLMPACAIAAAADLASVLSPEGPSNAVARSDAALALLALAAPVPGTEAITFVLGIGDLLFSAIALGAAARHGISLVRVGALALAAFVIALGASAALAAPIPALVPLGVLLVAGVPEMRRVRAEDRRPTAIALGLAAAVVLVVAVR